MQRADATALVGQLASGQVSARELAEASIAEIEARDGELNAVVVRDFCRALEAAALADGQLAAGIRLPLLGVPVTIKESFDVAGLPTSWGLEVFRGAVATEDSIAVARLRAAGAIILGKTNVSEGLDGWNGSNPVYGATGNPLAPGLSPGGSSSGAAASVAAGYVPLDIGSDLGGSIRGPAQFCGIFGHVASGGLIPLRGHALAGRKARFDLSCPGPFARSARDLDLALQVMAGPDSDEGVGYRLDLPPPRATTLRGLRVLVLDHHPMVATDPEVRAAVELTAGILRSEGAAVASAIGVIPDLAGLTRTYLALLGGAISLGMDEEAIAAVERRRAEVDPSSIAGLKLAGMVASHAQWLEANEQRVKLRWAFKNVFSRYDALICPAFSVPAITQVQSEQGGIEIDGVFTDRGDSVAWTALGNTAALPATIVPVTKTQDGRPVAVQVIGPYLEDRTTIELAKMLAVLVAGN